MSRAEEQLARMRRTADDLAAVLREQPESALARRPAEDAWAAKEVICHLRDTEEVFQSRFRAILDEDEPKFTPLNIDGLAVERQYLKDDAARSLETFRARRQATLTLLASVAPAQMERGGVHPTRGRMTIKDFVTLMASHDDTHLEQIKRSLSGQP